MSVNMELPNYFTLQVFNINAKTMNYRVKMKDIAKFHIKSNKFKFENTPRDSSTISSQQ